MSQFIRDRPAVPALLGVFGTASVLLLLLRAVAAFAAIVPADGLMLAGVTNTSFFAYATERHGRRCETCDLQFVYSSSVAERCTICTFYNKHY